MKLKDNIDYGKSLKKLNMENNTYTPGKIKFDHLLSEKGELAILTAESDELMVMIVPSGEDGKYCKRDEADAARFVETWNNYDAQQTMRIAAEVALEYFENANMYLKADSVKWYAAYQECLARLKQAVRLIHFQLDQPNYKFECESLNEIKVTIENHTPQPDDIPPTLFTQSVDGKDIDNDIESKLIN